jgi:hypothetical protein
MTSRACESRWAAGALALIYGQTVVVVPSQRLVIARFGTTYDIMMAIVDICRLTADTIAAL